MNQEEAAALLEAVEGNKKFKHERLTVWEVNFVEDLWKRVQQGSKLHGKTLDKLKDISTKWRATKPKAAAASERGYCEDCSNSTWISKRPGHLVRCPCVGGWDRLLAHWQASDFWYDRDLAHRVRKTRIQGGTNADNEINEQVQGSTRDSSFSGVSSEEKREGFRSDSQHTRTQLEEEPLVDRELQDECGRSDQGCEEQLDPFL